MSDLPSESPLTIAPDEARHIVDVLIEERARHLLNMPVIWPLIKALGYPLLKYKTAVQMADDIAPLTGFGVMDHVSDLLKLNLEVIGAEHVPASGRFLLVANHPTGIADGIAVYDALKPLRADMCFFANADALRVNAQLEDLIIPVEWVDDLRTAGKSRAMVRRMATAFRDENAVILFPSGKLAGMSWRGLKEEPWMTTAINLARRNKAQIVPLNIGARNSALYYVLRVLNHELRDMTLFNELLNKVDYPFRMTFGAPISHEQLTGDPATETERLRHLVEDRLGQDPSAKLI